MIIDRNGQIVAVKTQSRAQELLYGNIGGRLLLKVLTAPSISKAAGAFMDSALSVPLIKPFIRNNRIDMRQFLSEKYSSYNEFFTRRIKPAARPIDSAPNHLISPCDSKLTVYKIDSQSIFTIKGSQYRIKDLLRNSFIARRYKHGYCMIFRLCVDDYHRYCYIDSGSKTTNTFIKGELHTVNPIALEHYNIYKRNCREYTVLHTDNFGDVVQIEVGAMLVGRICNRHQARKITRGDEKGKFEFGGSTIVLLFEKNTVIPDPDILENSAKGIETAVKYGARIGTTVSSELGVRSAFGQI